MPLIVPVFDWSKSFDPLVEESALEGFQFLTRLRQEWRESINRFSANGEALFAVMEGQQLVAIGGINRQSEACGRLRRLYVAIGSRRKGIGRLLVGHILEFSRGHFSRIVLRTDNPEADHFYLSLGFSHVRGDDNATHAFKLEQPKDAKP
jgi:GNAT superfamily N-acetyltransferase